VIQTYNIHPAHDVAHAANSLRHAIREMYDAELAPDRVGLGTVADMMDVVAEALDRHWWTVRPTLDTDD
jgi:hypothetical protein